MYGVLCSRKIVFKEDRFNHFVLYFRNCAQQWDHEDMSRLHYDYTPTADYVECPKPDTEAGGLPACEAGVLPIWTRVGSNNIGLRLIVLDNFLARWGVLLLFLQLGRSVVMNEDLSVACVESKTLGLLTVAGRPNSFCGRNPSASCYLRFHCGYWSFWINSTRRPELSALITPQYRYLRRRI
jgi:hypothetical protein